MNRSTICAMLNRLTVCAMLAAASVSASAQYRFDLRRNFFATDAEESVSRKQLVARFTELTRVTADHVDSADELLAALRLWSDAERLYRFHDIYFFARNAIDTTDRSGAVMEDVRRIRRDGARAMRAAICALDSGKLHTVIAASPSLQPFAYFIRVTKDQCAHALPAAAQAAADEYRFVSDPTFYFRAIEGVEATADENEQTRRYAAHQELFAYGLRQIVGACDAEARLTGYRNCIEKALANDELTESGVRRWYAQIAASSALNETRGGTARPKPTFSISEAIDIITRAVEPLGSDYVRETRELLDPRNGRIDVEGGAHRLPMQGTSTVDPVGTSIFYGVKFGGRYIDLMMLAHESGHAVQAMLMSRAGVAQLNGRGPAYMTESFGRFNEFLAADYLYRTARDAKAKEAFREELLERARAVFGATTEGAVELALHDRLHSDGDLTPKVCSDLTAATGLKYSNRFRDPQRRYLWTRVPTFYAAPLHSASSAASALIALAMYARFLEDRTTFVKGYTALLARGYDAPSADLLRQHVGIDIASENFVPAALSVIQRLQRRE